VEHPDDTSEQQPAEGEPGRDEVAGERGGQPGYDLDEADAYERGGDGSESDEG
jgi:hypothetical protein